MRVLIVIYDNGSMIHWFPQGPAYVAAALRKAGHEVTIWNQDVHHWPDSKLTEDLDAGDYDVVGLGVIAGYYQYRRLLALSEAINRSKKRPTYVLGGFGPTPEPEFFLRKTGADYVVMGEGEETAVELFGALQDKQPTDKILGIAWRDGESVRINPRRPLIQDLSTIAWPAYDLFPMENYRLLRETGCANEDFVLPVLSGRGCTFTCNFCYRMDEGFRPRQANEFLDEVEYLQKQYGISYVAFSDELLMNSRQRVIDICETILKRGMSFRWTCNGRLNYATPEVLSMMKKAGCTFINYGIEAFDAQVLKNMKKALTIPLIENGIQATLDAGISPGLNILFGNIGDNRETLRKGVDFLMKYDNQTQMRTIRPVTPYPGSPLYYKAIQDGKLRDIEDFYENKHTNSDLMAVNFTDMTDEEFYEALMEANTRLLENYHKKTFAKQLETMHRLYIERDASFRGFRTV